VHRVREILRHVAGLHLPVDLVLHAVGVTHEIEVALAVLAGGLDVEVARADDAVDDPLVEVDVVDPLERDLDALLRDHPGAVDHRAAGDHEVGHHPLEVLQDEPRRPRQEGKRDEPVERGARTVVVDVGHDDHHDDQERDPVKMLREKYHQCGRRSRATVSPPGSEFFGYAIA
jgi:hypothetical protein